MVNDKAKEIDLGSDFGAVALKVNGIRLEISIDGKIINIVSNTPVVVTVAADINTPPTSTAIAAAQEALVIGQKMKDGTVVIAVDLQKNLALFAPEGIFGGKSDFDHQDGVVKKVNEQSLAGHKDWRRITDQEASALAKDWPKVAPPALQGSAAPRFWGASTFNFDFGDNYYYGRVYRGGEADCGGGDRNGSRLVPVVRSGPARS